jgi:Ca2+-binding EF-hand superfamily protein
MDLERPRDVPLLIRETKEVLSDVSADDLDELIVDLFKQAEVDRLNVALGQEPGQIGLWQFRRGIRCIAPESLLASKKKDLLRALERTFSTLDKNSSNSITWSTLEFFLRTLSLHADRECRRRKSSIQIGWDELSLLRVGKALVKNITRQGTLFGQSTVDVDTLFAAMDLDSNGEIDKQELRSSLRRLDCGLTLNQEEAMLRVIDTNGDGVIDLQEFRSFIMKVKKNMVDETESKERLKAGSVVLMEDIIKACKYTYSIVEEVCHDLRDRFQESGGQKHD